MAFNLFSGLILCGLGLIGLRVNLVAGLILSTPGLLLLLNVGLLFTPWLWPRYFSMAVNAMGTLLMGWLVYSSMQIAPGFNLLMGLQLAVLAFYALFIHQSWVMVRDKQAELRDLHVGESQGRPDVEPEAGWDEGAGA